MLNNPRNPGRLHNYNANIVLKVGKLDCRRLQCINFRQVTSDTRAASRAALPKPTIMLRN